MAVSIGTSSKYQLSKFYAYLATGSRSLFISIRSVWKSNSTEILATDSKRLLRLNVELNPYAPLAYITTIRLFLKGNIL